MQLKRYGLDKIEIDANAALDNEDTKPMDYKAAAQKLEGVPSGQSGDAMDENFIIPDRVKKSGAGGAITGYEKVRKKRKYA